MFMQESSVPEQQVPQIESSQPVKKTSHKIQVLMIGLFVLIIIFLVPLYLWQSRLKNATTNQTLTKLSNNQASGNEKSYKVPLENILVYTRCFGNPDQAYKNCFLYLGALLDAVPAQSIFPKGDKGVTMTLNDVTDKKALITVTYSDKRAISLIDLATGIEDIIFTDGYKTKNGNQAPYGSGFYFDKNDNKVFFTTETAPGQDAKLMQYDIATKSLAQIARGTIKTPQGYSDTFSILADNNGKLFLTVYPRGGSANYQWFENFDIKTSTFEEVKEPKDSPIFDASGQHIAYIRGGQLIVESTDSLNQKIIYTITNIKPGLPPYPNIGNVEFNTYGDTLSFTVNNSSNDSKSYLSYLEVRKNDPDEPKGGIALVPDDNPNLYKELKEFTPPKSGRYLYKWIKYFDSSVLKQPFEGLLYPEDIQYYDAQKGPWLIMNPLDNQKTIPVIESAKEVFILPK
jgi:hypothetical protein